MLLLCCYASLLCRPVLLRFKFLFTTCYAACKMSNTWPHDVLIHIFSYLQTTKELNDAGLVCQDWYVASTNNELWRPHLRIIVPLALKYEYQERIEMNMKQEYCRILRKIFGNLQHRILVKKLRRNSHGFLYMLFIMFSLGLVYIVVVVPLLLDGIIPFSVTNVWYVSIPSWLCLCLPVIIFMPWHIMLVKLTADNISPWFKYPYSRHLPNQWIYTKTVISVIGSIPVIFICIHFQLLLYYFGTNAYFSVCFIPVYIFTMAVTVMQVFSCCCSAGKSRLILSFPSLILQICITLQLCLIAAKLDQLIISTWVTVLIPLWILFAIIILGLLVIHIVYTCWCFQGGSKAGLFIANIVFLLAEMVPILILIWLILFALRLDLTITIAYHLLFIPLYVVTAGLICLIFVFYVLTVTTAFKQDYKREVKEEIQASYYKNNQHHVEDLLEL
jgi:hypothetical protein